MTKTAGWHRHIFGQNTKILINICRVINDITVQNLVFEGFFHKHQVHHWFLYYMKKTSLKDFWLSTEIFRWGTLCGVSEKFEFQKILCIIGGIRTFHRKCLVSQYRKLQGTLLCFRKTQVSKKIMHKGGGVLRFSVENFLSHFTEKLRRGPFCLTKIRVSKNRLHERGARFSVDYLTSLNTELL